VSPERAPTVICCGCRWRPERTDSEAAKVCPLFRRAHNPRMVSGSHGRGRHLPSTQYRARSAPPAPAQRCGSACRTHLGRRIASGTRQVRATRTRASVRPLAEHLAPRCQDSGPLKIS
jgi:hypothetical protein